MKDINSNSICSNSNLDTEADFEHVLEKCIESAGLLKDRNTFFLTAKEVNEVHPLPALLVANGWRELTKAFMFTTIAGVGSNASQADKMKYPPKGLLSTMQTCFSVIGDDLSNINPEFKKVAPTGVDGMHYAWWESSVVDPLKDTLRSSDAHKVDDLALTNGALQLIENMRKLVKSPFGAAIQLRVVEAIALEITIAFKYLFSQVVVGGEKIFTSRSQFLWMDSHIKVEVMHNDAVSDHDTGMAVIADTREKREEMLKLTKEYAANWNVALEGFAACIRADSLEPHHYVSIR